MGAGITETGNSKGGAHFGGVDVCRLACLPDIQGDITVSLASLQSSKRVGVT